MNTPSATGTTYSAPQAKPQSDHGISRGTGRGGRGVGPLRVPRWPSHNVSPSPSLDAHGTTYSAPDNRTDQELTAASAQAPLVQIHGLKKSYTLKPILRGIDLKLCRGERMALLGANGAGKTTLLRILAGLTRPSAGTVSIDGLDSVHDAQQVRHLVGFVAHQSYLYEELTALENLLFFARMYTVAHGQERARELLQRVGLQHRQHERVGTFSRGQLQRLAWARALLHSPRLLLLDESDTGLDQQGQELIESLLTEHTAQGGSTLFTTHLLEQALHMSDQVVILAGGRIVYQHATATLTLADLQQAYREVVS